MPVQSWNFIGQNPEDFRHYGPVAQDFFAAFGHDGIGTIGTPTTINAGDMAGILMAAITGLEKRTVELKEKEAKIADASHSLQLTAVRANPSAPSVITGTNSFAVANEFENTMIMAPSPVCDKRRPATPCTSCRKGYDPSILVRKGDDLPSVEAALNWLRGDDQAS